KDCGSNRGESLRCLVRRVVPFIRFNVVQQDHVRSLVIDVQTDRHVVDTERGHGEATLRAVHLVCVRNRETTTTLQRRAQLREVVTQKLVRLHLRLEVGEVLLRHLHTVAERGHQLDVTVCRCPEHEDVEQPRLLPALTWRDVDVPCPLQPLVGDDPLLSLLCQVQVQVCERHVPFNI